MDRVILHCDMNAFYASVELLARPELAERPVAVCGDPAARHGIILAKNERAKAFGVSTAETVWSARRKCPELVLLGAHHEKYREYSRLVNDIYCRFTDMVEPFSIDESWLDVTGSGLLFGDGRAIGDRIRETVRGELGLTLSVGVSFNKVFAKMGSEYKKPDATTVIDRGNYRELLWPLPVGALFFVGAATAAKLAGKGVRTIGRLASCDRNALVSWLGKQGGMLHDYANGADESPVRLAEERRRIKSVGNGITFKRDIRGADEIRTGVTALSDTVAGRLRKYGLKCHSVKVDIKDPYFKTISRQKQLAVATDITEEIIAAAMDLIARAWGKDEPIRLITVTACNLRGGDEVEQLSFFGADGVTPDAAGTGRARGERIDRALDGIRRRYGDGAVTFGSILHNDIGIDPGERSDAAPDGNAPDGNAPSGSFFP
ncbi:MAG: DNA polymerase IV [Clostridiales Family XIII bacterium]|jgi:DNA polymerase-4|nr:DNA polymerase IV [Clostridiales Family XIII bacterium]